MEIPPFAKDTGILVTASRDCDLISPRSSTAELLVVTETVQPPNPKVPSIWTFTKKSCSLLV